jgi:hypothetical protein
MITGEIGKVVTLTAKAATQDWDQDDGPEMLLRVELDGKSAKFTPGHNGLYRIHAGTEKFEVRIGPEQLPEEPDEPEQPEQPTPAGVIWDTNIHGKWNNGIERRLTGHHEFDKYDPTFEVAAGKNRLWIITGKGKCIASGIRTRGYQHTPQHAGETYVWEDTYIHNSSLENFSKQFFSNHNEDDPPENRHGGPTFAFYNDKIKFEYEYWHNVRTGSLGDSHTLKNKIVNGQETKLKVIGKKIIKGSDVSFEFQIFVNGQHEWNKSFTSSHPKAAIKPAKYWRNRINGDAGPKNVEILHSRISKQ